jgi:hypothetical protein
MSSEFSHTFVDEGVSEYQCNFHPGSMFGTITVVNSLSVSEIEENEGFRLFPNPSSSLINLEFSTTITSGSLKILDVMGRRVMQKSLNGIDKITLDMEDISNGVYLIAVQQENTTSAKRFVKN